MLRKSISTSSYDLQETLKKIEVARLKGSVVSSASRNVINIMNSITESVSCRISKANTDKMEGRRLFNGILILTATVTSKGINISIDLPIRIENSIPKLPNINILKSKLDRIRAENEAKEKVSDLSESVIQKIKAREEKVKEESGKNKEKREAERNKKAKDITLPSGGFTYTPSGEVAHTIRYPKANLPQSLEVGDVITVAGRKYKVEEGVSSFQGEQPSTEWNLILQE